MRNISNSQKEAICYSIEEAGYCQYLQPTEVFPFAGNFDDIVNDLISYRKNRHQWFGMSFDEYYRKLKIVVNEYNNYNNAMHEIICFHLYVESHCKEYNIEPEYKSFSADRFFSIAKRRLDLVQDVFKIKLKTYFKQEKNVNDFLNANKSIFNI